MSQSRSIEVVSSAGAEHLDPSSSWWIDGWAAADEAMRVEKIRECINHAFNVELALKRKSGFVRAFVIPNREWLRKIQSHLSIAYPTDGERRKDFHLLSGEMRWFGRTLLKQTISGHSRYNAALRSLFFGTTSEKSAGVRTLELKRCRVEFGSSDMDADFRAPLIDLLIVLAWDHVTTSKMREGKKRLMRVALQRCLTGRQWQTSGHPDLDALMPLTRPGFESIPCIDRAVHKQQVQDNPALLAMVLLHDLRNDDLLQWGDVYRAPGFVLGLPVQRRGDKAASISIASIFEEWLPGGEALVAVAKATGETPQQLLRNLAAGANQECVPLDLPYDVEFSL